MANQLPTTRVGGPPNPARPAGAGGDGFAVVVDAVPTRVVRLDSPIEYVESIAACGWPGREHERLGGWLLRAGSGASSRSNSALPCGDPGMGVQSALRRVVQWYTARGLPPQIQLPRALGPRFPGFRQAPDALLAELRAQGWKQTKPTLVLVGDLVLMPPPLTEPSLRFAWADEPDEAWWAVDGSTGGRREETTAAPARYLSVGDPSGEILAVGRLALVADWCGLSNLGVLPSRRGQGHGRRALAEMLAEGSRQGSAYAYLQVLEDNAVAQALYARHGFAQHHAYDYWSMSD